MTEQYTPSESVVRDYYVGAASNLGGLRDAAFDRFLARVRREAKAEGWDEGYLDRSPYGGRARSRADNPYRSTEQEARHDGQR